MKPSVFIPVFIHTPRPTRNSQPRLDSGFLLKLRTVCSAPSSASDVTSKWPLGASAVNTAGLPTFKRVPLCIYTRLGQSAYRHVHLLDL